MIVPPIIPRRDLPLLQREALDLMLRALVILDSTGEDGPAAHLSGAIDDLIDAPSAREMSAAELADLAARMDAYQDALKDAALGAT